MIKVCDAVGAVIIAETERLVSSLPELPESISETAKGEWLSSLSAKTTQEQIDTACVWDDSAEAELAKLHHSLSIEDPAAEAAKLGKQQNKIIALTSDLTKALEATSPAQCAVIFAAKDDANTKVAASAEYASKVFGQSVIEGVGSPTWAAMWKAARTYSQEVAYPETQFPNTADDAVCVLCQQELTPEASKRMLSFEEFTKSALEVSASQAKAKFKEVCDAVIKVQSSELIAEILDSVGAGDELKGKINTFRQALESRRSALLLPDAIPSEFEQELDRSALTELAALGEQKKALADQKFEETDQAVRQALFDEHRNLQATKWCSEQKAAIVSEVARLKLAEKLEKAFKFTKTASLSRKQSELSEELITKQYIERFGNELERLSAQRLSLTLVKTKTTKGLVHHEIKLRDAEANSEAALVLSEGEFRIVSLAAFLATVQASDDKAPFVFDDPISSLDQEFETATVKRLIDLSSDRQVVVFTHRLSLLSMLERGAKNIGRPANVVNIRREDWGCGEPTTNNIYAMKTKSALNLIRDHRIPQAAKIKSTVGSDAYNALAKGISGDIRILLERMVEEDLLNGIVSRFSPELQTKNRLSALAQITEDDCAYIDRLMSEYSTYEHSQSQETPLTMPDPEKLDADTQELAAWLEAIKKRK